ATGAVTGQPKDPAIGRRARRSSEPTLLEGGAPRAHLVGRKVPGPCAEHIGAGCVVLHDPNGERTARAVRHSGAPEREVAVVADPDPPAVTRDVLVDLELHLEPPVVRRDLDLPIARVAARPLADHVVLTRQRDTRAH